MADESNGHAVAALVLGICGLIFSVFFFIGFTLGVLAVIFGALGRGRTERRTMATWGLWLGIASIGFSIFGLWTTSTDYFDSNAAAITSTSVVTSFSDNSLTVSSV